VHAFVGSSAGLCDTPEEREVNNCRACGGESECHEIPQSGPCHAECGSNAFLEIALASEDPNQIVRAAAEINANTDSQMRVEFNEERELVQLFSCKGVIVRQVLFSAALREKLQELALANQ